MIPYKILIIAALVFSGIAGGFVKGCSYQKEKSEAREAVWQAKYDAQVRQTEKTERDWKEKVKDTENGLKAKLSAATANSRDLSRKLLQSAQSRRPLSETPGPAEILDGTSGGGGGTCEFGDSVEQALTNYFGASSRDAIRLNAWISFYNELRRAQEGVE